MEMKIYHQMKYSYNPCHVHTKTIHSTVLEELKIFDVYWGNKKKNGKNFPRTITRINGKDELYFFIAFITASEIYIKSSIIFSKLIKYLLLAQYGRNMRINEQFVLIFDSQKLMLIKNCKILKLLLLFLSSLKQNLTF